VTPEEVYRREIEQRGRWRTLVAEANGKPAEVFPAAESDTGLNLKANIKAITRLTIRAAMRETNGHRPSAARLLGISQRMLYYYLAEARRSDRYKEVI
jgi:DNA-binding NtrC family response regulator